MRTGKKQSEILKGIPLMLVLLLGGVALGTLAFWASNGNELEYLKQITDEFIVLKQEGSFWANFGSSLFGDGVLLIFTFLVGYFALGKPIAMLIPVFKGMGLGVSMSDIFSRYGSSGLKISLIFILPSALICGFAIAFACREAGRNSSKIFACICSGNAQTQSENGKVSFSDYIIKFAVFFILVLISSACDGAVGYFFGSLL